jgi:diacylglycerol kinase (ATP)
LCIFVVENIAIMVNTPNEWFVIVNPNAGQRKAEKHWEKIALLLKESHFDFCEVFTEKKYHAIEITQNAIKKGFRKIIVVGGDGTMNEVMNGIMLQTVAEPTSIKLGMIPVGTGNDWCRMYNIPFEYKEAIKVLQSEKTFMQDVGKVCFFNAEESLSRFFINVTGLGFDGCVAIKHNRQKEKGKGNKFSYLTNMFAALLSYRSITTDIQIDEKKITEQVFSMNVGVCKYNGGGMIQVPEAIPNDGFLDLTIIKKISKIKVILNVHKLYNGKIATLKKVSLYKAQHISISAQQTMYIEVDGESLGHSPFEFSILPSAICVIVGNYLV